MRVTFAALRSSRRNSSFTRLRVFLASSLADASLHFLSPLRAMLASRLRRAKRWRLKRKTTPMSTVTTPRSLGMKTRPGPFDDSLADNDRKPVDFSVDAMTGECLAPRRESGPRKHASLPAGAHPREKWSGHGGVPRHAGVKGRRFLGHGSFFLDDFFLPLRSQHPEGTSTAEHVHLRGHRRTLRPVPEHDASGFGLGATPRARTVALNWQEYKGCTAPRKTGKPGLRRIVRHALKTRPLQRRAFGVWRQPLSDRRRQRRQERTPLCGPSNRLKRHGARATKEMASANGELASTAPTNAAGAATQQAHLAALLASKLLAEAAGWIPRPTSSSAWLPSSARPYNPLCDAASCLLGPGGASASTVARTVLVGLLRGRSLQEALASASAAAQAALVTDAASTALKRLVGRSRPPGSLVLLPFKGRAWMLEAFPSEHAAKAAAAAALQVAAAGRDPNLASVLLAAGAELEAILIAALRVGSGLHSTEDVVGGWILGHAVGAVVASGQASNAAQANAGAP